MSYYYNSIPYLLDPGHGLGIQCRLAGETGEKSFYEDGTLCDYQGNSYDSAINVLLRYANSGWSRYVQMDDAELDYMIRENLCTFQPMPKGEILVSLADGKKAVAIKVVNGRYSYDVECTCKERRCKHIELAAQILLRRIDSLKHAYIVSEAPVDKSLFIDPFVRASIEDGITEDLSKDSVEKVRALTALVDAAKSEAYYKRFHEYLLDLEPVYNYDAHFLEKFDYFLYALFEDEGYCRAVLSDDSYADAPAYEGRQHRSNRAAFKRILRDYKKVVKELDEKDNFEESENKEFLLKYRGDYRGLLKYYAVALTPDHFEAIDLPYLEIIADDPEADPRYCKMAAEKIDSLGKFPGTSPVFQKLLSHLSQEDRIDVYSRMTQISMTLADVQKLDREAQKKLIYNMPLTAESFSFIMEDLLAEATASEKGRYILEVLNKVWRAGDKNLTNAVVKAVRELPDNRLLAAYVSWELDVEEKAESRSGKNNPEAELSSYFDLDFQVENRGSSFRVLFSVSLPQNPEEVLLCVEESGESLQFTKNRFRRLHYKEETIRKACLAGREDEYRKALEENRDAVDTFLFSQKNKKFAKEYQALCETLKTDRVKFEASEKVGIDWLFTRENGSNAVSFKVGNTRKYVVKDAGDFINAFRTGQTTEYGKDLVLSHDPENLQESDAAMIRLLMAGRWTRGRASDQKNKRYLTVNDSLMDNLLGLLEGRAVTYNEQPCLVRLQKQKQRLRINKKYVLSTDLKKGQELFSLVGKGYLVSRSGGEYNFVIDRVDASPEEVSLLELVQRNPAVSVKPILKDFKKNIYSRFYEMFDVDPALSNDFRLSEIRLNSYFDYQNGSITVQTKVLRDGVEIPAEQLTERLDLNKLELLQNYLMSLGFTENRMEDEAAVLSFFKMDFTRLKKLTNVYLSETLQKKEIRSVGRPMVRVTYQNNLIRVFMEKSDFSEAELEQIIRGLRMKKKYILLGEDRIIDLDSETARDFYDTVEDFGMNPKDLYRKKTVPMVTAIKAFSHEKSCIVDRRLRNMIEEIRSFKEADLKVPALSGSLRDYQREGYNWLSILTKYGMGGILADDMGLGKTIQIIALIKSDTTKKPSLVVCPKSLVFNWLSEFTRFDGETKVVRIYGTEAQRSEIISSIDYQEKAVYVTSYDSLRNDIGKYTGEFHYGILDEAQYIKNVHAQKTKSVKELNVTHRFALTGTPIENSIVDLWSIFDYILPGYFEELSSFKSSEPAAIARKSAPFILRRVKEDVLDDLPPKYERILSTDMSSGQRKLYEAMRIEARGKLNEGGKAFDLLPYLTRLRQVCVDPSMFLEDYREGSGKLDTLRTLIPEYLNEGHRILIFSQFVKALESVRTCLDSLEIPAYFLSGATPARDRIEMMDAFNSGSGTDVFLISLKAGGTGLNLTGADTVIHLDPWWNVAAENQASDRTHRIGQTRNVEVIKLIAENSIEQRVVELQDMKKDVINQVISDDDGSVTSASLEDIAFILQ